MRTLEEEKREILLSYIQIFFAEKGQLPEGNLW